ncbi:stage III sporulation protein AF [Pontibacillus salicampi]|uniref:Stage III sporulation protein AF n=1 Tax=Pontibacillus salicampi TaxID=1449801 RepID=A0ABV6LJT6_9BACI
MDYIMNWVTQVILFLLLALVTDLLLPNSSLRKYIKLVVGLLLILVFMQPIFDLFEVDMKRFFSKEINGWNQQSEVEEMENLIDVKKNEIQASQRAYILEQMAVQLKKEAKEELMNEYEAEILDFSFQFASEEELTLETLEQLTVVLSNEASEPMDRQGDEIEQIQINLESSQNDKKPEPDTSHPVKPFLAEVWEIPEDKITLQWEGGV